MKSTDSFDSQVEQCARRLGPLLIKLRSSTLRIEVNPSLTARVFVLSLGTISWSIMMDKFPSQKDALDQYFLRTFRKAVASHIEIFPLRKHMEVIAAAVRSSGLQEWTEMERQVRSTFIEWAAGSGPKEMSRSMKKKILKEKIWSNLGSHVGDLSKGDLLELVGEAYDENLVRTVMEE